MHYWNGGDWLPSGGIWKSSQLFPKVDEEEELPELRWVPPTPVRPPGTGWERGAVGPGWLGQER